MAVRYEVISGASCSMSLIYRCCCRFFERIAKTYRREKWGIILRPLLATWYACAQQLGDVELSVRLLVEMLGHGQLIALCQWNLY